MKEKNWESEEIYLAVNNVSRLQRKFEFINFGKDNLFFQLTLRVFEMFISWMFTITRIPPFWIFRGSFPINQRK